MHQLLVDFKTTYDSVRRDFLYNILIVFGIPMKLVRLLKNASDWNIHQSLEKQPFDIFAVRNGLKQVVALSPLFFNFVLLYAIRRVKVNQDGLKLNGPHQLLVYADVNLYCTFGKLFWTWNVCFDFLYTFRPKCFSL